MRIINVIETKNNIVQSVESFGIHEEQLSGDTIAKAEKFFFEKCKKLSNLVEFTDDIDVFLENGYYEHDGTMIAIVWSYIDE